MQITKIQQKGNSECFYIFLNDDMVGTLQLETIVKNHLKEGSFLEIEQFNAIKKEDDKLTCFSRALKYISSRLKTEKQMKDYLSGLKYDKEAIEEAIKKLKNYGYINDEYYAKTFIEIAGKTKGKRYLKQQLISKGVSDEQIELSLENSNDDNEACENVCRKWLKNKPLPLEQKDKEKLYRFLLSRGFNYDTIKEVLNNLQEEEQ